MQSETSDRHPTQLLSHIHCAPRNTFPVERGSRLESINNHSHEYITEVKNKWNSYLQTFNMPSWLNIQSGDIAS
jgi:hypothetical protein